MFSGVVRSENVRHCIHIAWCEMPAELSTDEISKHCRCETEQASSSPGAGSYFSIGISNKGVLWARPAGVDACFNET
jgi:hypothetical protein